MKYIDIDDKETMAKFPEAMEVLQNKAITSLPLIAFDGTPLWLGSMSYYYIMEELKKRGVQPVA